ncbi:MAG: glycosyltransferase family 1 protein [Rhodanobacteraceae bacterium]|nr:MAG: glycosyltransferase family 1 protein [Rhodanobacteraceae bacterium]
MAMLRRPGADEFWVALNSAFAESTEAIRCDLADLLPAERCVSWQVPGPTAAADPRNAWRAASGEVLRETFLESLAPDWVHIGNLFQGFVDGSLESVPTRPDAVPVAVTHHDLIPLVYPRDYITSPQAKTWYFRRLESLKRAPLVLTNSEFTRSEAIEMLGLSAESVVCIGCAASSHFAHRDVGAATRDEVFARYGITRPFVMYTGGADPRKNVEGLIRAFSMLPAPVRQAHQLVFVGKEPVDFRDALLGAASKAGIDPHDLVFTGFVPDDRLVMLYNLCSLFVFPSLREGFGLPALEGMACGAPVIASNTSSLPEVIRWPDAMFDPHSDEAIAKAMHAALTDESFRTELIRRGTDRAKVFTWERSAQSALDAMRAVGKRIVASRTEREREGAALATPLLRRPGVDHVAWREVER